MQGEKTSLLLVGRSGQGKSSTGNSILGEKIFQPSGVGHQSGMDVTEAVRFVNDTEVQVVDATGLVDNDQEFPENADHFIDLAEKAMQLAPETGYSAIVLVLKYGARFTKQETVAIEMINSLFGLSGIQHHGVIVMTCGDQFKEEEGLSFQQWCGLQGGELKRLMKECGQRCVLFDNKTRDPDRQRQQVQQLMDKVEQVKNLSGPYTKANFQEAESGRKKLRGMAKVPKLELKLENFQKDVNRRLDRIETAGSSSQELGDLWQKVEQFEADLLKEGEGTVIMTGLITKLDMTKQRLINLRANSGLRPTIPVLEQPHSSERSPLLPSYSGATRSDSQVTEEGSCDCYFCRCWCHPSWWYRCCRQGHDDGTDRRN